MKGIGETSIIDEKLLRRRDAYHIHIHKRIPPMTEKKFVGPLKSVRLGFCCTSIWNKRTLLVPWDESSG